MSAVTIAVGAVFAAIGAVFLLVTLGTLGGAVAGSIVGLFFGDTILGVVAQLGLHVTMWQLGATLGFVGGFLRTTVSHS